MRLQKQESRKVGNRTYSKWTVNLPSELVEKAGWKEGEEIGARLLNNGVLLFPASVEDEGKEVRYKETTKKEKYSPGERFLRIYNNLPISERGEVVVVVRGEPMTWKIVRNHIAHDTPAGKKILKKLCELEII